ncbi:diguanylate cyclase domain-containing protein [Alkalilimnicola sp. S0819]|uniref:diguanylate cyclase domain-containing protein n=1 Tax=Alkalilimnicola sp. S0819 TaxID=2613922 RepID=UPI001262953F|nr:diguanylate cyclase [Alkalilimnicola sp. S0819]KAB7624134.1 diguanylate cyclase [Alkalilimnicola sp. S0819]MPQ16387.1 diguanylate cyclase [Alkalilimnicola sp. S0819]
MSARDWPGIERILLLEDDEDDYTLVRDLLAETPLAAAGLDWAADMPAALGAIAEQRYDVILADYRLGARTGVDFIEQCRALKLHTPIVLLTGQDSPETDEAALAAGAVDYLIKADLDAARLERALRYATRQAQLARALHESRERYSLAMRGANDGLWDWERLCDRAYFSPRWQAMLGLPEESVEADLTHWLERVHPEDAPRLQEALQAHLDGETPLLACEHRLRGADGNWLWVLVRGMAVFDAAGQATRVAGSLTDISANKAHLAELLHAARHDGLTELANRTLFNEQLELALERLRRYPARWFAVLFIDLDGFKGVNDRLGHQAGDAVLVEVARRLREVVRGHDLIARLGGDEFTVLADEVGCMDAATRLAERIIARLAEAFCLDVGEARIGASVGIAWVRGEASATQVLREADAAMYQAKQAGKGRFVHCSLGEPPAG